MRLLLFLLIFVGTAFAESPEMVMSYAQNAAAKGKVKEALIHSRRIKELGVSSGKLSYNLGVLSQENGDLPAAVYEYRQAVRAYPLNGEFLQHLRNVRQSDIPGPFENFRVPLSVGAQRLTVLLTLGIILLGIMFKFKFLSAVGIVSLFAALGMLFLSEYSLKRSGAELEVFIPKHDRVEIFGAPAGRSQVIELAAIGSELVVDHREEDWIQVSLPSGRAGWVKGADGYIDPD